MMEQGDKQISAFINNPETMRYLIKRWKEYANIWGRNHGKQLWNRMNEVFDEDPKINHEHPQESSVSSRYTLVDQETKRFPRRFSESAERMHGINFFDEIQNKIDEKKSKGDSGSVSILITGSDVGFLNDELRVKFGNQVDVSGTTLELLRAKMRKKRLVESIRNGNMKLPIELQKYLSSILKDTIDPRDSKLQSILQMQNAKPEFDKIIDTCGELLYSYEDDRPEIFEMTFEACIAKLNPGGKLYISNLAVRASVFVRKYCQEHNLKLEEGNYRDRRDDLETHFIITKPS